MCNILLEYDASIERSDRDGRVVLHSAVEHNHPELVELYIQEGADVNQPTGSILLSWF